MFRPRVIIADIDENYIKPLQFKFIKEFFDKIDLEIITEREYFEELFRKPQAADVLIVSDTLYNSLLHKHNLNNIFIMMEQYEEGETEELNVNKMFKYTSVNEIFNEIVGKSGLKVNKDKNETQIILVTSASGGSGKTTTAMGICTCLSKNYKQVLYVNASRLQSFQYMLNNQTSISSQDVYVKLANPKEEIYSEIKHIVCKEIFSYIPEFKAALMSLGLEFSIYEKIVLSAKKSGDYDYIVIDAESTFDEHKTRLLDIADKVVIITEQSMNAVYVTNALISNINSMNSNKYIFICNKFIKEGYNALVLPDVSLKFTVNEYIEFLETNEPIKIEELSQNVGIRKVSSLVM